MKLLYTKSNSPLSWLIRWGLNEPVSHVAIELDGKIIFHSNLRGVHLQFSNNFKKKNTVVFIQEPWIDEEKLYMRLMESKEGRPYDVAALLYFIWRGFLYRFFQVPMPKKNKLDNGSAELCVELIRCLPSKYQPYNHLSMTTPYQAFLHIERVLNDKSF